MGATTCGWRARWSGAHRAMVSLVRRSPSAWAVNSGTRTGWSIRRDWTCRVTTRRRSAPAAGSASATTVRSARSPRWAARLTSTSTAARCRHIWCSSRDEPADMSAPARIPPGGFRELGPINWAIAKLGARGIRAPKFHLFDVLGQHRLLFLAWLPFSGYLLYAGKLSRKDAELVILRVGHLRDCEYELQQHRRVAKSRGLGAGGEGRMFEGAAGG